MATYIVKCFGSMADCFYGTGEWRPPQPIPASQPIPDVILDTSTMGKLKSVIIVIIFFSSSKHEFQTLQTFWK